MDNKENKWVIVMYPLPTPRQPPSPKLIALFLNHIYWDKSTKIKKKRKKKNSY